MVKKMSDDDVMDLVYGKLFGDLDGIESHAMFDEDHDGLTPNDDVVGNAKPETGSSGGVKVTIEPILAATSEGSKPGKPLTDDADDDEDEDKLKGIGGMSPLMAQLHGGR